VSRKISVYSSPASAEAPFRSENAEEAASLGVYKRDCNGDRSRPLSYPLPPPAEMALQTTEKEAKDQTGS
jgi:hypothetical protein